MRNLLFTILGIICTCIYVSAIDTSHIFNHNVKNGLPTNNVYSFIQDGYGYIWIATDNGVVKYNGYSFKLFGTNEGLPTNDVWMLKEDKWGRIWIYTYATELGYIRNNTYKKIDYDLRAVAVPKNNIWEFKDFVVAQFFDENMTLSLKIDSNDKVTATKQSNMLVKNVQQHIYAVWNDQAVRHFNFKKGTLVEANIGPVIDNPVFFRYEPLLLNDSILVGFRKGYDQIPLLNVKTLKTDNLPLQSLGAASTEFIYNYDIPQQVNAIFVYTNKATYILNNRLQLLNRIPHSIIGIDKQVSFYMKDRVGNMWLSTPASGMYFLPGKYLQLKHIQSAGEARNYRYIGNLSNTETYWWDKNGNIPLVIRHGIIKEVQPIIQGNVTAITYEKSNVYLSTLDKIAKIDSTGRVVELPNDNKILCERMPRVFSLKNVIDRDSIASDSFRNELIGYNYRMFPISDSVLYLAGDDYIRSLSIGKDTIRFRYLVHGRFRNSIFLPYSNICLFYNNRHIALIDVQKNEPVNFNMGILKKAGVRTIHDIAVDSFHNIYICTDGKLAVFNLRKHVFTTIPLNFNTSNIKVEVYGNHLVIAGKFGLAYAQITDKGLGTFHALPNVDNRLYERLYEFVIDASGTMVLQTDNGIYTYTVSEMVNWPHSFHSDNHAYMGIVITNPYLHSIKPNDTLSIAPSDKSLSFDCINFYGDGNRYFNYRIAGFRGWQQSATGEIILPDFKPQGYYRIDCYVADDSWQSNVYTFYIYKQPLWWQTKAWKRIFWVTGILLAAGLVLLIVIVTRYYVNRANEKKTRLLDLELRAVHSQINPHFIFNSLSSALFFINRKDIDEAYKHVSKFSKLLRSYLKSSHERYVTLTDEISMLKNYIELQQTRFENKFDYVIEVENKIAANNIKIPSLLLQPIVENAINHGLFHKKGDKGILTIRFLQGNSSEELICEIEDNGVGRKRAAEIKRANDAQRESYGTRLTERLIDIFQEYEHMNIFLEYIDKAKPYTGTIARLTIKNIKYDA